VDRAEATGSSPSTNTKPIMAKTIQLCQFFLPASVRRLSLDRVFIFFNDGLTATEHYREITNCARRVRFLPWVAE
jgi:hypothetical protein